MRKRFWCAVAMIALSACVQKEEPSVENKDLQMSDCPFDVQLDTLNALDVGFIYKEKEGMREEYDEAGIIYYKKTVSSSPDEITMPLYVKRSGSRPEERRATVRVDPESEYVWRPYSMTGNVRTLYDISTFKVGKPFSVSYIACERGAVLLDITVPFTTEVSYMCVKESQGEADQEELLANGLHRTFKKDGRYYVSAQLEENTRYKICLIAKEGVTDYTDVFVMEFVTGAFVEYDLLNLVDTGYDGFTMKLNMPSSVKITEHEVSGSRAIRYAFVDLLQYNLRRNSGYDDYWNLLYNGSKFLREDYTIDISDENIWAKVDYDANDDGVIDENDGYDQWNPIVPGEPVVFVAGEFEWMHLPDGWDDSEDFDIDGFTYPKGWEPGYYLPCLDSEMYFADRKTKSLIKDIDLSEEMDSYWTGAFQRKMFRVKEPGLLEAEMEVNIKDVSAADATIEFVPGDGVYSYCFCVLDKRSYDGVLDLLDNHDEYLQWFVTSYYAFYSLNASNKKGRFECNLADYFIYAEPDSEYHILVTALGDAEGTSQRFIHEVVYTTSYETDIPNIEVSAAPGFCTPGNAVFRIRNLDIDNPVTTAYRAVSDISEWEAALKTGATYTSMTDQNIPFTSSELEYINSESGYYMTISGETGQTMRMAVVAYNKEGRSNKPIDEYSSAVADCAVP